MPLVTDLPEREKQPSCQRSGISLAVSERLAQTPG